MFDNFVVVYKFISDVYFYVVSSVDENEIVLSQVLQALTESSQILLRYEGEALSCPPNNARPLLLPCGIIRTSLRACLAG